MTTLLHVPPPPLSECGYFDQAHFIHGFRAFSGVSPTAYLRDRTSRNHVAVHD